MATHMYGPAIACVQSVCCVKHTHTLSACRRSRYILPAAARIRLLHFWSELLDAYNLLNGDICMCELFFLFTIFVCLVQSSETFPLSSWSFRRIWSAGSLLRESEIIWDFHFQVLQFTGQPRIVRSANKRSFDLRENHHTESPVFVAFRRSFVLCWCYVLCTILRFRRLVLSC